MATKVPLSLVDKYAVMQAMKGKCPDCGTAMKPMKMKHKAATDGKPMPGQRPMQQCPNGKCANNDPYPQTGSSSWGSILGIGS